HEVHFISYALPYRLNRFQSNLFFHEVEVLKYPLFEYPPYSLSLASKMVEVVEAAKLDILHVHYAIPHATSAFLAREMADQKKLKYITTLHGTDITLLGADPSYFKIVKFSIEKSDGVTAVSEYLKKETQDTFQINNSIRVIPNFIPDDFISAKPSQELRNCCAEKGEFILTHISNFRPLKRIPDLIYIINKLPRHLKIKLLMVGDGPDRFQAEKLCKELGLCDKVVFMGKQENISEILAVTDLFLLPSENESFGLVILEAHACGVPCITTNAGGIPEVNLDGETGFTVNVGDIDAFAGRIEQLIENSDLRKRFSKNARIISRDRFSADKVVPQYLNFYEETLNS
ncbi:MAG TPA: N-acetyl-alpha-D-glucosaminyl L-malate synthase BshA, partial [Caldithrix sp.]|nr:N-acetyl-alpha-D-glucosaminyl L-malate synthase BshA [Caldithrix sp.]